MYHKADAESGSSDEDVANESSDDDEDDDDELREGLGPEPPRGVSDKEEESFFCGKSLYSCFCNACYPLTDSDGASGAPRLEALDAPRGLAAVHIVLYHFYCQKSDWMNYMDNKSAAHLLHQMFDWGSSWLNFFFILSGFLLAYVEMARPRRRGQKISILQYTRKRMLVLYPTYLLSLVFVGLTKTSINRFDWSVLPLHLCLMQAWLPICVYGENGSDTDPSVQCSAWSWNGEAWFMSVLVVYWLMLRPLTAKVRRLTLLQCYALLVACGLWSLIFYYIPRDGNPKEWSALRRHRLEILMRASPWGYLHIFLSGILAARIFMLTAILDAETKGPVTESTKSISLDSSRAPCLLKYGCSIGYASFLIMIMCRPEPPYGDNGGCIPFMFLIILGAALGVDPMTVWLFRSKPMLVLGQISYVMYIMQRTVYDFMFKNFDYTTVVWAFPLVLMAWAYFVQRWYETPYTEWQQKCIQNGEDKCGKWIQRVDSCAESTQPRRMIVSVFLLVLLLVGVMLVVIA